MPEDGDYTTLLATIAGIGGVLIGLYYAGVTAVGSAIYARVPNNIRDLLARDQVGIVYIRYLAFLTFLSLVLICFKVFGIPVMRVAIPLLGLMAGVGIIAFVKLGQRAFNLFDPTALSDAIFRELRDLVKRASVGGFGWNDPAFQANANRKAQLAITTLETLADVSTADKNLSGRSFAALCMRLLEFLRFYEQAKTMIPSASEWYTRQLVHPDWYHTDDSRVSLAHQTGTALDPESVPNRNWVEDELLPTITRCVLKNIEDGHYDVVFELLRFHDEYIQCVCEYSGLARGLSLVEDFAEKIFTRIAGPAEELILDTEVLESIGMTDYIARLPITCVLAFIRSDLGGVKPMAERLGAISWARKSSLYLNGFKAHLLPQLEWLQPRLEFEQFVEQAQISPTWYQADIVCLGEAKKRAEDLGVVFAKMTKVYRQWVDLLNANRHPWLAAAAIGREWEYCHKLQPHLSTFRDNWNALIAERKLRGLDWPSVDPDNWKTAVGDLEKGVQAQMAQICTLLTFSRRPANFPDYPGQFLHTTGEAILDSFVEGDIERIKLCFLPYFLGCLKKFDELRPKSTTADDESMRKLRVAGASLLDLLCLSGYARLFADLHSKDEIWAAVTSTWDRYLSTSNPSPLPMFSAVLGLSQGYFGIAHRGILRTRWSMVVDNQLRELPRRDVVRGSSFVFVDSIPVHPSPMIRVLASGHTGSPYDGETIFASFYCKKRPDGASLSWGQRVSSLEEAITRQEKNAE